jgi:hypothetical protein
MNRCENDDPEKVLLLHLLIQTIEIHIFAKISEKSKKDLENIFVLFLYEKILIFAFLEIPFLCFYFILFFVFFVTQEKRKEEIVEELSAVNKKGRIELKIDKMKLIKQVSI